VVNENLPGVSKPIEFNAYIETPYYVAWDRDMNTTQVGLFSETGYSYYGMNNIYNAARIWEVYKS